MKKKPITKRKSNITATLYRGPSARCCTGGCKGDAKWDMHGTPAFDPKTGKPRGHVCWLLCDKCCVNLYMNCPQGVVRK